MEAAKVSSDSGAFFSTDRLRKLVEATSDDLMQNKATRKGASYQGHFSHCREAITRAVQGLEKVKAEKKSEETALILGAGGANDLPLKMIAHRFSRIVLVDIDLRHTRKAVARLPEELRKKFTLEQADLTGIFNQLASKVEKIAHLSLPHEEFVSKVLDLLPTLERSEFEYQQSKASFVCSSLVSSQLCGEFMTFLNEASKRHYRKTFDVPAKRDKEFSNWLVQVQLHHVKELTRLVKKDGKVFFADHFTLKHFVRIESVLEKVTIHLGKEHFNKREVTECLSKLFVQEQKSKWPWVLPVGVTKGTATVGEGEEAVVIPTKVKEFTDYHVTAFTLRPRLDRLLTMPSQGS